MGFALLLRAPAAKSQEVRVELIQCLNLKNTFSEEVCHTCFTADAGHNRRAEVDTSQDAKGLTDM